MGGARADHWHPRITPHRVYHIQFPKRVRIAMWQVAEGIMFQLCQITSSFDINWSSGDLKAYPFLVPEVSLELLCIVVSSPSIMVPSTILGILYFLRISCDSMWIGLSDMLATVRLLRLIGAVKEECMIAFSPAPPYEEENQISMPLPSKIMKLEIYD